MEQRLNPDIPYEREKLRRLFLTKKAEMTMMARRGFSLGEVYMMKADRHFHNPLDLSGLPNADFQTFLNYRSQSGLFGSRQEFSALYVNRSAQKVIVVLYLGNEPGKQVAKEDFKLFLHFVEAGEYKDFILITENGLNPDKKSQIKNQIANRNIQVFLDKELVARPLEHVLSPIAYSHIPAESSKEWAASEGLQLSKLPIILNTDPLAKEMGAKPLDAFQTEQMGTEVETVGFYRIVRQPTEKKKK